MIQFRLVDKKHQFNLGYGDYRIFFVGGFAIDNFDSLAVRLTESESGNEIELKEISWKPRDIVNGRRAIACYSFWIDQRLEYQIEFDHFENLKMKKSMLFFRNLLFPSHIPLDDIEIVIK